VCIVFKGLILLTKLFISYNKGNVFLLWKFFYEIRTFSLMKLQI
jgi:hypothetical protein